MPKESTVSAFPFLFVNKSSETIDFGTGHSPIPPGSAYVSNGMDLRDYLAAAALTGLLSSGGGAPAYADAERAYTLADAMLEARK